MSKEEEKELDRTEELFEAFFWKIERQELKLNGIINNLKGIRLELREELAKYRQHLKNKEKGIE